MLKAGPLILKKCCKINYPFSHIMKTEHLPELSVLMSIVHDKKERRKSNALRSTNLRDSDQH